MKRYLLVASIVFFSASMVATEAEAKRFGGGRSIGTQRNVTNIKPAQPPAKQAQPPAGSQQAAGAPAAAGGSRWMPVLGGLALGGLLGALFSGGGFGGILLLVALGALGFFAFRAIARLREASSQPLQYAGAGDDAPAAARAPFAGGALAGGPGATPAGSPTGAMPDAPPAVPQSPPAKIPSGFDSAAFLRAARLNFMRLQVANDLGRWDEIREFTTPELFASLQQDGGARSGAPQQTDIVNLQTDLLEVTTEGDTHWASLRFSGMVREAPGEAPVAFAEIWNLSKPADGSTGWLLAGIQQPD